MGRSIRETFANFAHILQAKKSAGLTGHQIGTYAIQNVETGKDLRPFGALKSDGNYIIAYDHHAWKCLSRDFQHISHDVYRLMNLHTKKYLQSAPCEDDFLTLKQQTLNDSEQQKWRLLPQADNMYLIQHRSSGLYITMLSAEKNFALVLQTVSGARSQLWRLIFQRPWI